MPFSLAISIQPKGGKAKKDIYAYSSTRPAQQSLQPQDRLPHHTLASHVRPVRPQIASSENIDPVPTEHRTARGSAITQQRSGIPAHPPRQSSTSPRNLHRGRTEPALRARNSPNAYSACRPPSHTPYELLYDERRSGSSALYGPELRSGPIYVRTAYSPGLHLASTSPFSQGCVATGDATSRARHPPITATEVHASDVPPPYIERVYEETHRYRPPG